jgi:ribosome-associated heat shock protein Hsp15
MSEPAATVRLDKWLQVARVFKTRSQATRACQLSRVRVNGAPAKPHRNLVPGDVIEVEVGDWTRVLAVRGLRDRPVPKEEARELYEDRSPPRPQDPLTRLLRRPPVKREKGAGRPTKKDRRRLDRLREE